MMSPHRYGWLALSFFITQIRRFVSWSHNPSPAIRGTKSAKHPCVNAVIGGPCTVIPFWRAVAAWSAACRVVPSGWSVSWLPGLAPRPLLHASRPATDKGNYGWLRQP